MTKTIVAVIGCGTIANSAHIPAYVANEGVEIKYFCDIRKERAAKAVEQYGCGTAVEDYRVILDDPEVAAVSICTPNNVHASIAIECMRADKHVLCEKPAARTYKEALEMQKVQHETGKTLNIGVVNRFNKGVNIIKQMIESGELGELYHVVVSFRSHRSIPGLGGDFTTKAVAGGGALIDWGVHFLDIVMYCAGDPQPKTVSGQAYSKLGKDMPNYAYLNMWAGPPNLEGSYDVDDFVTAMIRTEGPSITVNGAWAQNIGVDEMYIDFLGDKAGIRLQYGKEFTLYSAKHGSLLESTPKYLQNNAYQEEIDQFIAGIHSGEKLPSHIDTVILSSQIIEAIYHSSEEGREISLLEQGVLG
ncbi:Gfo/Idh/MocA family oxidoreductase [Paenibacillus sp.]|jgi:predicted dehydrogenase|uniref:Gfo/Idh/MocA family protein n=1 Tax=Paenibacillus sp. TaxID=58172 RepID=UPI00282C987A|nr:Gfo/Idh/MocA family oxidoreductase [Paenibacillus sp.]MDR0269743.1 Gfo/Idh/MocA family oxidoreductase [Paenibacillus sp.]